MVPPCLFVLANKPLWSYNGLIRLRLLGFTEKAFLFKDSGEFDLMSSSKTVSGSHLSLPTR